MRGWRSRSGLGSSLGRMCGGDLVTASGKPGGVLAKTEVNVLQAVNLTLGTSAFLALADKLPDLFGDFSHGLPGRLLYAVLLLSWAVKLLVENHRSFAGEEVKKHPGYSVFQLIMTILMFITLIASARKADILSASTLWLSFSLAAGVIWLLGLAVFHAFTDGFRWRDYPWIWLVSAGITVVGAATIYLRALSFEAGCTVLIVATMVLAVLADAVRTNTFSLVQKNI